MPNAKYMENTQEDLRQAYDAANKIEVAGFTFAESDGDFLLEEDGEIVILNVKELVQRAVDHASAFSEE